jgi:pyruvyltransferase
MAVRGSITRDLIGAPKNTTLGDPGLLISDVIQYRQKKKYRLGFVPHYHDLADYRLHILKKRYKNDVCLINVLRSPIRVSEDINRCENIISSSLHGLVVADSLGIPNRWAVMSDKVFGKGFKFRDYYSAMGIDREPISIDKNDQLEKLIDTVNKPEKCVKDLKNRLRKQFESLKTLH